MNTRGRMKKRCEIKPVKENSVPVFELQGTPIREMMSTWIAGILPIGNPEDGPFKIDYVSGKL